MAKQRAENKKCSDKETRGDHIEMRPRARKTSPRTQTIKGRAF